MYNTENKDKLIIENLSKSFGNKKVLNDLSFTVRTGEFLSILGSSGCGKTTILRILIGLERLDKGKIIKDGIDITNMPASKRGMGIIFQQYALFENMTVLENVLYPLKKNKEFKAKAKEMAISTLETVQLENCLNMYPRQLSGGQQQRVAIARTLALQPEIILFDEPMSALDADTRLVLRGELKDLQKKYNTTMIFITHDQEEAFALSDRIMVMQQGEIEEIATPLELINNSDNPYVKQFVAHNINQKINSLLPFASGLHSK